MKKIITEEEALKFISVKEDIMFNNIVSFTNRTILCIENKWGWCVVAVHTPYGLTVDVEIDQIAYGGSVGSVHVALEDIRYNSMVRSLTVEKSLSDRFREDGVVGYAHHEKNCNPYFHKIKSWFEEELVGNGYERT